MKVDVKVCSSSFLMYRTIQNEELLFSQDFKRNVARLPKNRDKIHSSEELFDSLKRQMNQICKGKNVALCLSGGIDSAILAKMLPPGTQTYTFKCIVPGVEVTDETPMAKKYAEACRLKHKVIEVYWEDFEQYAPLLMKHKGAPIHSIEVIIYKAALEAKKDGIDTLIFGESADCLYGGLSMLLSRDWTVGEFSDRYPYVKPYHVLKNFDFDMDPILQHQKDGFVDVHSFLSNFFFKESTNSYINACQMAGMGCLMPYANTVLDVPLDLDIIRSGKNKYIVRNIFEELYPGFVIPPKTPMPRPMNEWLKDWEGPKRSDFWPHCTDNMSGDQKWLVWSLERFLNQIEAQK